MKPSNHLKLLSVMPAMISGAVATENWHEDAFFGLHYILHAQADDTELGRQTTYERIRTMLEKVQPGFVQYDCKGQAGYAAVAERAHSPGEARARLPYTIPPICTVGSTRFQFETSSRRLEGPSQFLSAPVRVLHCDIPVGFDPNHTDCPHLSMTAAA
jgi:hypothetical protein